MIIARINAILLIDPAVTLITMTNTMLGTVIILLLRRSSTINITAVVGGTTNHPGAVAAGNAAAVAGDRAVDPKVAVAAVTVAARIAGIAIAMTTIAAMLVKEDEERGEILPQAGVAMAVAAAVASDPADTTAVVIMMLRGRPLKTKNSTRQLARHHGGVAIARVVIAIEIALQTTPKT